MPLYESKNTFVVTVKAIFGIFLLALVVLGILAFLSSYNSLGWLCVALVAIIGGFWRLFADSNKWGIGLAILIVGLLTLFATFLIGSPQEEWKELTDKLWWLLP